MSIEDAQKFVETVKGDKKLRAKLRGFEDLKQVMKFVKGEGEYDFTLKELKEVRKDEPEQEKLTDDQLAKVSGGFCACGCACACGCGCGCF